MVCFVFGVASRSGTRRSPVCIGLTDAARCNPTSARRVWKDGWLRRSRTRCAHGLHGQAATNTRLVVRSCASTSSSSVKLLALAAFTTCAAVANRVIYKMQLSPLNRYSYLVTILCSIFYSMFYVLAVLTRKARKVVTGEMLAYARSNLRTFGCIGFCESFAFSMQIFAAAYLPGALIPVVAQSLLPFSMLTSRALLGTKYDMLQKLGAALVATGVITCVGPPPLNASSVAAAASVASHVSIPHAALFCLSTLFFAVVMVLKERLFRRSPVKLDVFVVNSCGSVAGLFVTLLMLPIHLLIVSRLSLQDFFTQGSAVLFGSTTPLMPWLTIGYIIVNGSFNIGTLVLIRDASAVHALLASLLALPLTIAAFALPLPLLSQSSLNPFFLIGVAILVAGVLLFNHKELFSSQNQS